MSMCVTHCCIQTQSKTTTFVPLPVVCMPSEILLMQLVRLLDKTMRESGGLSRYREQDSSLLADISLFLSVSVGLKHKRPHKTFIFCRGKLSLCRHCCYILLTALLLRIKFMVSI